MFLELCKIWPDADIYTTVYDEDGTEGRFAGRRVYTSFLQRLRPTARTFRALLPLYPAAIESFDLSDYDLVVSSSSAWAHAVICDERSVHVSYCYNPFRYAWNDRDRTLASRNDPITRAFLRRIFRRWRQWDWIAAQRTDRYIAISRTTQARIRTYFGRESNVVYPPVATERFSSRTARRPLRARLRTDVAQTDRGCDRGVQRIAPAARRRRRRSGRTPPQARRGTDDPLHRPRAATARSPTSCRPRGRSSSPRSRSSGSRPWSRRRPDAR